jgi:exopolyphosphatase/guanosine-5'-triphosphate,3'-diphosphate pyrophosphatase
VAGYVRKKLGDARHERRVAELASRLFTLTSAWHDLRATDLVALRLGCLLHDVGRSKDDALHPRIGARMIERADELPLTPRERRLAAFLTRYHRGAVPRCGHDEYLRRGEYRTAVLLLAMLRAADALDSRSCGGASVTMERRPGEDRKITLRARPHDDTPKARKGLTRPKKYRLLETALRCEIRVRVD